MSFEFYVSIQKVKENGFNLKSKPLPLEQITKTNTKKKSNYRFYMCFISCQ